MNIQVVNPNFVAQSWPQVAPFIDGALKYGEDYSIDQVKMYLTQGIWILLVAVDQENNVHGAMTISFQNYPNDRVAFVTTTGGNGICTPESLQQMKSIVASMGATKIQAGGRPSMVRLLSRLGFVQRYTVVETKI